MLVHLTFCMPSKHRVMEWCWISKLAPKVVLLGRLSTVRATPKWCFLCKIHPEGRQMQRLLQWWHEDLLRILSDPCISHWHDIVLRLFPCYYNHCRQFQWPLHHFVTPFLLINTICWFRIITQANLMPNVKEWVNDLSRNCIFRMNLMFCLPIWRCT